MEHLGGSHEKQKKKPNRLALAAALAAALGGAAPRAEASPELVQPTVGYTDSLDRVHNKNSDVEYGEKSFKAMDIIDSLVVQKIAQEGGLSPGRLDDVAKAIDYFAKENPPEGDWHPLSELQRIVDDYTRRGKLDGHLNEILQGMMFEINANLPYGQQLEMNE